MLLGQNIVTALSELPRVGHSEQIKVSIVNWTHKLGWCRITSPKLAGAHSTNYVPSLSTYLSTSTANISILAWDVLSCVIRVKVQGFHEKITLFFLPF